MPAPRSPRFKLPAGAVDAHCHVFGPGAEFPFAAERKYTPCDASRRQLFALRDHLGFARNIIVQATCHGADNRAMVDALEQFRWQGARHCDGSGETSAMPSSRRCMTRAVRGVRFNFVKRLVDFTPKNETDGDRRPHRQARLACRDLFRTSRPAGAVGTSLPALPTIIVVDHMGRPDVSKSIDGPEFELFVKFMGQHANVWSKVSCPERLSVSGPAARNGEQNPYCDGDPVRPAHRRDVFPIACSGAPTGRIPISGITCPTTACWLTSSRHIAATPELQRKLLVDNPMRLYWPEKS